MFLITWALTTTIATEGKNESRKPGKTIDRPMTSYEKLLVGGLVVWVVTLVVLGMCGVLV